MKMTQIFQADTGKVVPVTMIEAGPCQVVQVKTLEKDGYRAAQVGFLTKRKISRPLLGHLKGLPNFRYLKEFLFDDQQAIAKGQQITADIFQAGEKVKVTGFSKGQGFQGVVKRHGFHGSPASHGHKDQLRMPGSIGATAPQHVFKGTRMAGRMGNEKISVLNLEVVDVQGKQNLIYLKGAVPGARNSLLLIQAPGEMPAVVTSDKSAEAKEEVKEERAPAAIPPNVS